MNKMKNLLAVLMLFLLSGVAIKAQDPPNYPPINENPQIITSEDIIAVNYTDSWWTVTGNNSGATMQDDNGNTVGYESATLKYTGTITTDYSPFAESICQWNRDQKLIDLSINQLLQITTFNDWGATLHADWNIGDEFNSPVSYEIVVSPVVCPEAQPIMNETPITIVDGIGGVSISFYEWSSTLGPALFRYSHNSSHSRQNCGALCAHVIPETVTYLGAYPGPNVDLRLPYDKNGICAVAWMFYPNPTRYDCYNLP